MRELKEALRMEFLFLGKSRILLRDHIDKIDFDNYCNLCEHYQVEGTECKDVQKIADNLIKEWGYEE